MLRSSIMTRSSLRAKVSETNANDGQLTIPTILRRKRSGGIIRHYEESSPVSSKESQKYSRKRKCPMPKKIDINDENDELEIISLQDSSDDDIKCIEKSNSIKSLNSVTKVNASKVKSQTLNKKLVTLSIDLMTNTPNSVEHCLHRFSPLPNFDWADSTEVWDLMLNKDVVYQRNALMLHRHPSLEARMRSMLIDWLSEVCEVYRLNRDTYYLCVDFIDRYLSYQTDIPKQQLQLLGITCLFIAAKIEEIYPPKLSEFAYVTDGACNEPEITLKELVILKALNWELYPVTINGWLTVYMQIYASFEKENSVHSLDSESFLIPDYKSNLFAQIAHLVDLCILDIGSLTYSYSIIAASALYHFTNEDIVYRCTGIGMNDIRECVIWMIPFALAIRDDGFDIQKLQQKVGQQSQWLHNIQSHTVDLQLLEKAHIKQCEQESKSVDSDSSVSPISSPTASRNIDVLTPPKSSSKNT